MKCPWALVVSVLGCDHAETVGDRPSQPTLTATPDPHAATTGRRIVAAAQISQAWHTGSFSPASITLPAVEAGDAILVLGVYWGDLARGSSTAPTDDRGTLQRVVDQATSAIGQSKPPPVFAQLYTELDAAPGAHTITPPYLGGGAGDGTCYVIQIRGLVDHRVVAIGQNRVVGSALPGVSVALNGFALPGDLVIALGGYDNTTPVTTAGWRPPMGWTVIGTQDDAANNVPSSLVIRVAPTGSTGSIGWAWADPTVNVAVAIVAAFR